MRKEEKVLDMEGRYKLGKIMAVRYNKARKKERGEILERFTEATGYNRCYAGWLLMKAVVKNFVPGLSPPSLNRELYSIFI